MTIITLSGFAAFDDHKGILAAIGETDGEVRAALIRDCGPFEDEDGNTVSPDHPEFGVDAAYTIAPASEGLLQKVKEEGGDIGYDAIDGACYASDDGRKAILRLLSEGADRGELLDAVKTWANCAEADIDEDGDIWIAGPQTGHWLPSGRVTEFALWLQRQ